MTTQNKKQNLYISYLRTKGFNPEVDEDGDVVFMKEGMKYIIITDEADLQFFRITTYAFVQARDDAHRVVLLNAANEATHSWKCSKIFLTKHGAQASIEVYLKAPEDFEYIFDRCLTSIQYAISQFTSDIEGK